MERPGSGRRAAAGALVAESAVGAVELDHVLFTVPDLDEAAAWLERRYGLGSVAGGRHPGWGTANRIVPLASAYIELIAVVDETEAAAAPFGHWITSAPPGRPLGWAVRTDDVDAVAARLGLEVHPGSRVTPDGVELRWRGAAVEDSAGDPSLPFFVEWDPQTTHPSASGPADVSIAKIALRGDRERLTTWLGPNEIALDIAPGEPGVVGVVLRQGDRAILLEDVLELSGS